MSGVSDFVSKAFKSVRDTVKKAWDNKLIRAAIIAVAVYYTAGMAAEAWAVPEAGMGSTLASSPTTFTTVAETTNVAGTASSVDIGLSSAQAAEGVAVGSTDALALGGTDALAAEGVAAGAGTGAGGAVDLTLAGETAGTGNSIVNGVVEGAKTAGNWMKENPVATMMLGQGVSGAVGSYEARKAEDRDREYRREEFNRRGTMGFNNKGTYSAAPGIVASQSAPATTAQKVRPIARNDLTKAYKQGLVRSQT